MAARKHGLVSPVRDTTPTIGTSVVCTVRIKIHNSLNGSNASKWLAPCTARPGLTCSRVRFFYHALLYDKDKFLGDHYFKMLKGIIVYQP